MAFVDEEGRNSRAFFIDFINDVAALAGQEVDNNEDWEYYDLEDYVREACEDGLNGQQEVCMVLAETDLMDKTLSLTCDIYEALRDWAIECLTEEIFNNLVSAGVCDMTEEILCRDACHDSDSDDDDGYWLAEEEDDEDDEDEEDEE